MKNYLKLIRAKHWLKNGLVFLPLFFSANLLNKELLFPCILSFLTFSFTASIVYIINDINDLEKDKNHPIKKNRPLASGAISIEMAKLSIGFLALGCIFFMCILYKNVANAGVMIIPVFYLIMNILYSKWLKNIPIIDVVIIVTGFVLRVMYGGICTNVEVSKYLYLMIIFGSFFLGFGKRRNEILKNGDKSRKVLSLYTQEFLDKNMYVSLALAVVSYTLWCVDPSTIARIGNDFIFWTIPLLMVILQLYSLNIEGNSHGDPIEVVLSDKKIIITVIIYIIMMGGILYL
ncbi:MAG: UbiA prenyltransferase family protein [Bacilli bacterium]|nr:UbiA prenyltransferase family protein [Bacilli bacterium]